MKIIKNAAVSLRFEILDGKGKDAGGGRHETIYLHGGYGSFFPKVESALEGVEPGGKVRVKLAPQDAFGERDPSLVRREPLERLPGRLRIGMQVKGETGTEAETPSEVFTVTALTPHEATLDANHPLAGRSVEFRCTVLDVRPATPEEIAHGHVHGPGGHHAH